MTNRERENATLSFGVDMDRGSIEETFYPWTLTYDRWNGEGHLQGLPENIFDDTKGRASKAERYLNTQMAEGVHAYERFLGFDGVKRMGMMLPFHGLDGIVLEEGPSFTLKLDPDCRVRKYEKGSGAVLEETNAVTLMEYWEAMKTRTRREIDECFTDENIRKIYGGFAEGHERGEYSIRFNIEGFFWLPRGLYGIEEHLYAFYEYPEIMHEINEFVLEVFIERLDMIFDVIKPDVVYILEDLSGKTGPMISPSMFDEFVGAYYRRLIPFMKSKGVGNVFVDTDGDFTMLIPNFLKSGVDGFLPLDVNAGVDIVDIRRKFPKLKLIGGFNKLEIAKGPAAIDREFERLMPVIRQGGYIVGCDHQVAPSTSFEDYKYYIGRLKEAMEQAGKSTSMGQKSQTPVF